MKILMENWRAYSQYESCDRLLEKYDRNLISHTHFLNTWEDNMIREGNELFTEGLMDLIQQGVSSAQELVGSVKEKFLAALTKVIEWSKAQLLALNKTLLNLYTNPQIVMDKLMSLYNKVLGWCKASPWLCGIISGLIIASFIAAIAHLTMGAVDLSGAGATIQMPSGTPSNWINPDGTMNEGLFNLIYGGLQSCAESSGDKFPQAQQAADIVRDAYQSSDVTLFENLPPLSHKVFDGVQVLIERVRAMGPDAVEALQMLKDITVRSVESLAK
jgi:hypothetical protein